MTQVRANMKGVSVVGLNGSLRKDGFTRRAIAVALAGAGQHGCETRMLDLWDYDLPLCDGGDGNDVVKRFRDDVRAAKGIVIGTPEYHGTLSGVLKNALDWLGWNECEGKVVGLVAVAGGALGGIEALSALRIVGRSLHMWVIPDQVLVAHASKAFAGDKPADARLTARLHKVGSEVARFTALHASDQYKEFVEQWQRLQEDPGALRPST
jgi:FMN reductase